MLIVNKRLKLFHTLRILEPLAVGWTVPIHASYVILAGSWSLGSRTKDHPYSLLLIYDIQEALRTYNY